MVIQPVVTWGTLSIACALRSLNVAVGLKTTRRPATAQTDGQLFSPAGGKYCMHPEISRATFTKKIKACSVILGLLIASWVHGPFAAELKSINEGDLTVDVCQIDLSKDTVRMFWRPPTNACCARAMAFSSCQIRIHSGI